MPDFYTGSKDVSVAGVAEQLPDQTIPDGYGVKVRAKRGNIGYIYVGESQVQAQAHDVELERKDFVRLFVTNTNKIWIDSSNSGEGAEIIVEKLGAPPFLLAAGIDDTLTLVDSIKSGKI